MWFKKASDFKRPLRALQIWSQNFLSNFFQKLQHLTRSESFWMQHPVPPILSETQLHTIEIERVFSGSQHSPVWGPKLWFHFRHRWVLRRKYLHREKELRMYQSDRNARMSMCGRIYWRKWWDLPRYCEWSRYSTTSNHIKSHQIESNHIKSHHITSDCRAENFCWRFHFFPVQQCKSQRSNNSTQPVFSPSDPRTHLHPRSLPASRSDYHSKKWWRCQVLPSFYTKVFLVRSIPSDIFSTFRRFQVSYNSTDNQPFRSL